MIETKLSAYLKYMLLIITILLIAAHFYFQDSIHFVLYVLAILPLSLVMQILSSKYTKNRQTIFYAWLTIAGLVVSFFIGGRHG
jgi:hypothetical protein